MLLSTIASNSLKISFRGCQQISAARQPLSGMSDNDKVFWDIVNNIIVSESCIIIIRPLIGKKIRSQIIKSSRKFNNLKKIPFLHSVFRTLLRS